jgi:cytoskeletal protein CcmA (bactofilin family)
MAFNDIKISQLPNIGFSQNDDVFILHDLDVDLTYKINWSDLKNSIGRLSEGIIFPLGSAEQPSVAIGDYASGIYGIDHGHFSISTQTTERFHISPSGTTEIINGDVVIGNYDRTCYYRLTVNNTSTFNCDTFFKSNVDIEGNLTAGEIDIEGDLVANGNVTLGNDCLDTIKILGSTTFWCDVVAKSNILVDGEVFIKQNLEVLGDINFGQSGGLACSTQFNVYSASEFFCDSVFDKNVTINGPEFLVDSEVIVIGKPDCANTTLTLNGQVDIPCGLDIDGDLIVDGDLTVNGNTINIGEPGQGCSPGNEINLNGQINVECGIDIGTDVNIGGDVDIDGNINIGGNGIIEGNLDILGDHIVIGKPGEGCSPGNEIDLNGNANLECDLIAGGDASIDGSVNIGTDLNVDNNLSVGGDTNLDGNVTIGSGCNTTDFTIDSATQINCDVNVDGTVEALYFKGDGSQLTNLPEGLRFRGDIDATTADASTITDLKNGDFWVNLVTGNVHISFTGAAGQSIVESQIIYYTTSGTTRFVLGSLQDSQGFVTINTDQEIFGTKTFKEDVFGDKDANFDGRGTFEGLTSKQDLIVEQDAVLKKNVTVAENGGTLLVNGYADFKNNVQIDGNQNTNGNIVGLSDLTISGVTTLGVNCSSDALIVKGKATFDCGIALPPGSIISGELEYSHIPGDHLIPSTNFNNTQDVTWNVDGVVDAVADKIVVRDNQADVKANHFVHTHALQSRPGDNIFFSSIDDKIYKNTSDGFRDALNLLTDTEVNALIGKGDINIRSIANGGITITDDLTHNANQFVDTTTTFSIDRSVVDNWYELSGTVNDARLRIFHVNNTSTKTLLGTFTANSSVNVDVDVPEPGQGNLIFQVTNPTTGVVETKATFGANQYTDTTVSLDALVAGDGQINVNPPNPSVFTGALVFGGSNARANQSNDTERTIDIVPDYFDSRYAPAGTISANDGGFTVNAGTAIKVTRGAGTNPSGAVMTANQANDTSVEVAVDKSVLDGWYISAGSVGDGDIEINAKASGGLKATGSNAKANQASKTTRLLEIDRTQTDSWYQAAGSVGDGQININAPSSPSGGLKFGGSNATANQSGNTTRTIDIDRSVVDSWYLDAGAVTGQWEKKSGHFQPIDANKSTPVSPVSDGDASLGTKTRRWKDVYTQDMHFSNMGKDGGNDVDGTTGDWTLQEGEDNLYLINNLTGKKFKISMEPV